MGSRPGLAALGALAGAGAAAAVWGIGIERHLFTVRHHTVRVLDPDALPIRILHLSDAHMAPWQHRKQEWIAKLASLRPDLIVNTGDNLGHREGLEGIRRAFAPFRGVPGIFVHGSNDLWEPAPRNPLRYLLGPSDGTPRVERLDTDALDGYLTDELGWSGLNNTATTLDIRGTRVNLFGVNDPHHRLDELDALPPLISELPTPALTLGVTHAPYRRVLDTFTDLGADAIFAGHTHGGQVRVPFYGALLSNCDLPPKQARGLSAWTHDGRTVPLNVSAGLGHSIYSPVRFACPPEVSLLTLAPRHG
ncbi:metallophosphoesterase [Microbacterium betulae]|uniref:Metallophosphoesterase n=1 Tax=Microbacterium betulae TaxID=2981139 RepID=A0AA97FJT4_9MICO|nr:metallophosphoesterase [Microbacterium sp. AB]WOF24078.1 metallophosphoesterase [Microbacterium sp. AB]